MVTAASAYVKIQDVLVKTILPSARTRPCGRPTFAHFADKSSSFLAMVGATIKEDSGERVTYEASVRTREKK
jgi:hypothetical protein